MPQLRAIIFDFDGVLADTERLHFRAFRDVLGNEGITLTSDEYAARYLGRSDREVFGALARDRRQAFDSARLQSLLVRKAARYEALVATNEVMIPGAAAQVRAWQRVVPLAVASGARRSEIDQVLGRSDLLGCFAAIIAAEDVSRGKPAPDPYLVALGALNEAEGGEREAEPIGAREVVAVEDSLSGLASIRAAGMHAVAVSTSYPPAVLDREAELVVASIAELDLGTLERLVNS